MSYDDFDRAEKQRALHMHSKSDAVKLSAGEPMLLYGIALDAIGRLAASDCDVRESLFGAKDSVVAAVFAALSVEAFLNELGAIELSEQKGDLRASNCRTLLSMAEEENGAVLFKLQLAFVSYTGKALDRGAQPFQDVALLMKVRNVFAHHRPTDIATISGNTFEIQRSKLISELASKGLTAADIDVCDPYTRTQIMATPALARWAVDTAVDVNHALLRAIYGDTHPQSFDRYAFPRLPVKCLREPGT